ncbi:MAG: hypothetical protein ACRD30_08060 [Bryobacteraceae bacterium]
MKANERDWLAEPSMSHHERDIDRKDGDGTDRTYVVRLINGSPYKRLIAVDGNPLPPRREQQEIQKEKREIAHRRSESSEDRESRIGSYQKDRDQDHLLMTQMAVAFNFHIVGEETISGHPTYVLDADPKLDYKPVNRDAKVLTGMRGKLWVDKEQFHWVKVEADVVKAVTFGGFLAKVGSGTRFMLEKAPVDANVWEPVRFEERVRASVLFWSRNSTTEQTFSDYQPGGAISDLFRRRVPPLEVKLQRKEAEQILQRDYR